MTNNIPDTGISRGALDKELAALREGDSDQTTSHWKERCFLFTFHASDDVYEAAHDAYVRFLSTDALSDVAFPSVGKLQSDLSDYVRELLRGGTEAGGTITTGGTESIILAMTAARNWARKEKNIDQPEVILAETAHPAFTKAVQLLDVPVTYVPVDNQFRLQINDAERAITPSTCMLVGSAPTYWHGVHDDIPALGELALKHDLWLHVDGCMGGLIGSFARLAGYDVPPFDFTVAGVRSISADFHKYGFSMKGASILMLRDKSDARYHTFDLSGFAEYVTTGLPGTKSGAAIASAWAVFRLLGKQGFVQIANDTMRARQKLLSAVEKIDGLHVNGRPALTLLTFSSDEFDIFAVASELQKRGWLPNTFHNPDSLHLRLTPAHANIIDEFIDDLAAAVEVARTGGDKDIQIGAYGARR